MIRPRALLFDLDGTLVDSRGDIAAACNAALLAQGRAPLPLAAVTPMIGDGARLLIARALAAVNGSNTSSTFLLFGSLLAVVCILDAGLLRRPWGVTLGWVLQLATLACAFVVPAMLLVGLLFGALWLTALATLAARIIRSVTLRDGSSEVACARVSAASSGPITIHTQTT